MNIQGVIPTPPFALLEFTGIERNDFLQRLLSNNMLLKPGQATSAYYLTVQGRPLARFWVFFAQESTWLVCPKELSDNALTELDKMHFGEKLRMFDRSRDWQATLLVGNQRNQWIDQRLHPTPSPSTGSDRFNRENPWSFQQGTDWLLCRFPFLASGSDLVFSQKPLFDDLPDISTEWELQRIQAARAWPTDWNEKTMFLEVADDEDYVDGKGCYPGQEVVIRTLHRGHINRHIAYITGTGSLPAIGCKLSLADKDVGWISSRSAQGTDIAALAFLRREAWETGTELQREDGGLLRVQQPIREAITCRNI